VPLYEGFGDTMDDVWIEEPRRKKMMRFVTIIAFFSVIMGSILTILTYNTDFAHVSTYPFLIISVYFDWIILYAIFYYIVPDKIMIRENELIIAYRGRGNESIPFEKINRVAQDADVGTLKYAYYLEYNSKYGLRRKILSLEVGKIVFDWYQEHTKTV
jgi:hypothetical protein